MIPGRVRERASEFGHSVNLPHAIAGPRRNRRSISSGRTEAAGTEEAQRGEIHAIKTAAWRRHRVTLAQPLLWVTPLGSINARNSRRRQGAKSLRHRNDHRRAQAEAQAGSRRRPRHDIGSAIKSSRRRSRSITDIEPIAEEMTFRLLSGTTQARSYRRSATARRSGQVKRRHCRDRPGGRERLITGTRPSRGSTTTRR